MDYNNIIRKFLKSHTVGVISSINQEGNPQGAIIEYGETDNFELIFDTFTTSRKYKNIRRNNNIAFTIGGDEEATVQYEGKAIELQGEEAKKYQEIYFAKIPAARKWGAVEGITFFKVIPSWVRYTNLTHYPWDIKEITF